MSARIKFHLDEHMSNALAAALSAHGVDVTTASDAGLRTASDQKHLEFARLAGRVLVTNDHDLAVLHSKGLPHSGIVYCPRQDVPIGPMLRELLLLWNTLDASVMVNSLKYMGARGVRRRRR